LKGDYGPLVAATAARNATERGVEGNLAYTDGRTSFPHSAEGRSHTHPFDRTAMTNEPRDQRPRIRLTLLSHGAG
jgi:hypothetical protein